MGAYAAACQSQEAEPGNTRPPQRDHLRHHVSLAGTLGPRRTGGGAAAPPHGHAPCTHGHAPCTAVCSFVLSSYPPVRTSPEARCDSAPSKWPPWSSTLPNSLLLGTVLRVGARTENGPRGGCGRRPCAGQPPRGTAAGHCPLPRGSGCRALTCSPLSVAFKLERNRSCCRGGKGMSPWQRRLRAR